MNVQGSELISLRNWGPPPAATTGDDTGHAVVDCGWGRLLFGQTFASARSLADELRREVQGTRDVALYIRNPQVIVAQAPQDLFIDPSLTFRLGLKRDDLPVSMVAGVDIGPLRDTSELQQLNAIYHARNMVPVRDAFEGFSAEDSETLVLVARDSHTRRILGCVNGVDHHRAFGDPDNGSSLWALAVHPQCRQPGVGRALLLALAREFQQRGRDFMDLSVMHDNEEAIALYKALGFVQVPVYCVKNRNAINESLYTGPRPDEDLNPYARIITEEAYRRGIAVEVIDAPTGLFRLSLGGRVINCRESLTDATTAVAMTRCDDKALTRRLLSDGDLCVPAQQTLHSEEEALAFLERHEHVVIKPARGEQGRAVAVDLTSPGEVRSAYQAAAQTGEQVLGEEFVAGKDLRIIVINDEVVAAAVRMPASVIGTDRHTIRELIEKQSRRRSAATAGESLIPMDEETSRCVASHGYSMDDVLPAGVELAVRKTANLHTGGTLHDVTPVLHPVLEEAARKAAALLDIPVVGLDLIVDAPEQPRYAIIEANERPGLANHEPQPTAARLLDFLFPLTSGTGARS